MLCAVSLGWISGSAAAPAPQQKKKTAARKPGAAPKKSAAVRKSAAKTSTSKKGTSKSLAKKRVVPRYSGQRLPTPERYKEIQEALASKGYLQGAPDGVWSQQSIDALKRFQQEQNLDPSGKINSLSLIALGLGPRRDQQAAAAPTASPAQP